MTQPDPESITFRHPTDADASSIRQLVVDSGVLDVNSTYLYLLLCRDFAGTCLVADRGGEVVGFVTAYRPPQRPDALFVWQVGVAASAQRQGIAARMLIHLVRELSDVKWIEATIAPSNTASRKLFSRLASTVESEVREEPWFQSRDFGGEDHEAEPLVRIGPLPRS